MENFNETGGPVGESISQPVKSLIITRNHSNRMEVSVSTSYCGKVVVPHQFGLCVRAGWRRV